MSESKHLTALLSASGQALQRPCVSWWSTQAMDPPACEARRRGYTASQRTGSSGLLTQSTPPPHTHKQTNTQVYHTHLHARRDVGAVLHRVVQVPVAVQHQAEVLARGHGHVVVRQRALSALVIDVRLGADCVC